MTRLRRLRLQSRHGEVEQIPTAWSGAQGTHARTWVSSIVETKSWTTLIMKVTLLKHTSLRQLLLHIKSLEPSSDFSCHPLL